MKLKKILLFGFLLICVLAKAQPEEIETPLQQQNVDTEENTKTKLGVRFAMGAHTFTGNAFDNEKLKYGVGIGIYNLIHLDKKKSTFLHWELNFTIKGSKFGQPNDTSFSRISISYIELPVCFSYQLTKGSKPLHALIGGQFSWMLRNSINKTYGRFGSVKTDLPFLQYDVAPVIGVRNDIGNGMSLQFTAKFGIMNIYNSKFKERADNPSTDPNKDYRDIFPAFKDGTHRARNLSFELAIMF